MVNHSKRNNSTRASGCDTRPLHGRDVPRTAVHPQDGRAAGFGVPVAQLPVTTISADSTRKGGPLGVCLGWMAQSPLLPPSSKDTCGSTPAATPCFSVSSGFSHLHHQEN